MMSFRGTGCRLSAGRIRGSRAVGEGWHGTGCWTPVPNPLPLLSSRSPEESVSVVAAAETVVLTVTDRVCGTGAEGSNPGKAEGVGDTSRSV